MDNRTKEARSRNMSNIPSKNTKPEEKVQKYLFVKGFRYRKNDRRYPGKPDLLLPKYKTAIFVNGCFWHKHEGCKYFVWPKSNTEFWQEKIIRNVERDRKNYAELEASGWNVIEIWECELKKDKFEITMQRVINELEDYFLHAYY